MHKQTLKNRTLTGVRLFQALFALIFLFSLVGLSPTTRVMADDFTWTAYNDLNWETGQPSDKITKYTIPEEGASSGVLVNYATGVNTPVTVNITTGGSPFFSGGGDYDGAEPDVGTDAYGNFHGIADMKGLIVYGNSGWYVDLTFSGLDTGKTYTFATSANRNNSSTDYQNRISRFTISGVDAAANASTSGVTEITNESVAFSTGDNTVNGYVACWTGIDPGNDGAFTVRVQAHDKNEAYGPSVFMLAQEAVTLETITVTADAQSKVYGADDPVLTYTADPDIELDGALARAVGENVDTYAINQGTLTAPRGYEIQFVGANLTITQRKITITADDQVKAVGDPDPVLTYTITPEGALVNGDEIAGELARDPGEEPGTYAITKGTLAIDDGNDGANYGLTFVEGTLTIEPYLYYIPLFLR